MCIRDSLSSMLWNFPGAPVDQVSSEADLANRWSPSVAGEARGCLGAMAFHERRIFDELRRLLPHTLDSNSGITLGLRLQELIDKQGYGGHGDFSPEKFQLLRVRSLLSVWSIRSRNFQLCIGCSEVARRPDKCGVWRLRIIIAV